MSRRLARALKSSGAAGKTLAISFTGSGPSGSSSGGSAWNTMSFRVIESGTNRSLDYLVSEEMLEPLVLLYSTGVSSAMRSLILNRIYLGVSTTVESWSNFGLIFSLRKGFSYEGLSIFTSREHSSSDLGIEAYLFDGTLDYPEFYGNTSNFATANISNGFYTKEKVSNTTCIEFKDIPELRGDTIIPGSTYNYASGNSTFRGYHSSETGYDNAFGTLEKGRCDIFGLYGLEGKAEFMYNSYREFYTGNGRAIPRLSLMPDSSTYMFKRPLLY